MNLLKASNAVLVAALLAATAVLLTNSQPSLGVVAALVLHTITFAASFIALQRGTKRLSNVGLWLNALLLAIFIALSAFALFVFDAQAVAGIAFQAVLVALPATANIVVLTRLRAAA